MCETESSIVSDMPIIGWARVKVADECVSNSDRRATSN